jgi:hypothetical protein
MRDAPEIRLGNILIDGRSGGRSVGIGSPISARLAEGPITSSLRPPCGLIEEIAVPQITYVGNGSDGGQVTGPWTRARRDRAMQFTQARISPSKTAGGR